MEIKKDMENIAFRKFTEAEDSILVKRIAGLEIKQNILNILDSLAEQLNREKHVLIQRCFQLGLVQYKIFSCWLLSHRENGWRSDEIDLLLQYPRANRATLANSLDRSLQAVSKQCFEMRLNNGGKDYYWSDDDLTFLRNQYRSASIKCLKQILNRSTVDIKHKMLQLGLFGDMETSPFTGRPCKKIHTTLLQLQHN